MDNSPAQWDLDYSIVFDENSGALGPDSELRKIERSQSITTGFHQGKIAYWLECDHIFCTRLPVHKKVVRCHLCRLVSRRPFQGRDESMLEMRNQGRTLAFIAKQFGRSGECVRNAIARLEHKRDHDEAVARGGLTPTTGIETTFALEEMETHSLIAKQLNSDRYRLYHGRWPTGHGVPQLVERTFVIQRRYTNVIVVVLRCGHLLALYPPVKAFYWSERQAWREIQSRIADRFKIRKKYRCGFCCEDLNTRVES